MRLSWCCPCRGAADAADRDFGLERKGGRESGEREGKKAEKGGGKKGGEKYTKGTPNHVYWS